MSAYTFQIDISGNAVTGIKQIESNLESLNHKTKEVHSSFRRIRGKGKRIWKFD